MIGILGSLASKAIDAFTQSKEQKSQMRQLKITQAQEELKANHDLKMAQLKFQTQNQSNTQDLDKIAMQNREKSFKDELILMVFLAPVIMAFIPDLAPFAMRGFEVISQMPEWYRYTLIGMIVVIYGMRGLVSSILKPKVKL